jgi:hypothetical protein
VLAAEVRQYVSDDGKRLLHAALVGQTEKARDIKGQSKQPPALNALIEAGEVADGDEIWLLRSGLPQNIQPASDDDVHLRFKLADAGGQPHLLYQPDPEHEAESWLPSKARDRVRRELDPQFQAMRAHAVNDKFALTPGGPSLGDLARELHLWS